MRDELTRVEHNRSRRSLVEWITRKFSFRPRGSRTTGAALIEDSRALPQ